MKKQVIFRSDGGPKIGYGHFIRSLALAEMLKDDFDCIFVTRHPSENQIIQINNVCKRYIRLSEGNSHYREFFNHLTGNEIVVLDNYYFDVSYQKEIKKKGCKLVCIDDLHDKHFVSDIVINHSEGINFNDYSTESYTKLFLGNKFALLRKEYLESNTVFFDKKFSCFLMMGGVDPFNITYKIVDLLSKSKLTKPFAVVLGSDYSNEQKLSKFNNTYLFKDISAAKIIDLMQRSQFGILPASTSAIEACAVRLPFICGYYIENQNLLYAGIKKKRLAYTVGSLTDITIQILSTAIEHVTDAIFLRKLQINQQECLDKKSKERFLKIFKEI